MADEQAPSQQQPATAPDTTPTQQPAQQTQPVQPTQPVQQTKPAEVAPDFGLQEFTRGADVKVTTGKDRVEKRG
jgi:hypothetical protein